MVKRIYNKRSLSLVITVFVITVLLFGNNVSAKTMKVSAQDLERIKTVLDITSTVTSITEIMATDNNLLSVLNKAIKVGRTSTDITYGLLILSAVNEMELIDFVLSQKYKTEARNYFDNILDERTNLLSYWKGIGFDIPKVASGYITGPIAGLTLNTFSITGKIIEIFILFENVKTVKKYDGLWYYFDLRKQGNEPHNIAWNEVKIIINWATKKSIFSSVKDNNTELSQLEQQFAALYEKWGPYATPYGIAKEYKEQLAGELKNTLAVALEENLLAEEEPQPSLWEKFTQKLADIKDTIAVLMSQINPFKAGPLVELPEKLPKQPEPELSEELSENSSLRTEEPAEELKENGSPSIEPPLVEEGPVTPTSTPELITEATTTEPTLEPEPELGPTPTEDPEVSENGSLKLSEPGFCQKKSGDLPRRYKVLINEVAWMGDQDSSSNEWIELKNIWGIPINLNGWQLLDKNQQIKIIFGENDIILPNSYYLLERTNDETVPGIEADLIYTGALSNTNEAIYLFNEQCNLEDEVLAESGWPAGDNSFKKPMQRLDPLYWYTALATPGSENSSPPAIYSNSSGPASLTVSPAHSSITYPKILITETYIESESNQKDDFVELYNPNAEAVDLTDWYIQRKTENAQDFSSYVPKTLLAGKAIQALNYFLIANASSSFATSADVLTTYPLTENNTLILKNPNQEIVDRVSTDSPSVGESYARKWSSTTQNYTDSFEVQIPTLGTRNGGIDGGENEEEEEEPEVSENGSLKVVINEIAWMGTEANSADEWIELFNNTTSTIDLTDWRLVSDDGGPDVSFPTSSIAAGGYFLIERTDDNTVSDILADWVGSFGSGLSNQGEKLELRDSQGNLIDSVDCQDGWFAGKASPNYISMERINSLAGSDPANWASNNRIGHCGLDVQGEKINGTPRAENSVAKLFTEVQGLLIFDEDFTLSRFGSPYIIEGSIEILVGAKLTIEAGVIIKFKHNQYWHSELKVGGELEAEDVVFTSFKDDEYGGDTNNDATSTSPAAGDWEWIYIHENAEAELKNVIIRYGGKLHQSSTYGFPAYTHGMIKVEKGKLVIEDSFVEKSFTQGLWINESSPEIKNTMFLYNNSSANVSTAIFIEEEDSNPTIASSTFIGNKIGILIQNGASATIEKNIFRENQIPIKVISATPDFSGNLTENNELNGILVTGNVSQDAIWQADLPYIIENSLNIASGVTLTVRPGVIVKFKGGGRFLVDGTLEAQGQSDKKIIFTALNDDECGGDADNNGFSTSSPGYWDFISFSALNTDSILDNVIVRYGGFTSSFGSGAPHKGAVVAENSSVNILNSIIENNLFSGVELDNSTSTIENTIFRNNVAQHSYWGGGAYSRALYLYNSHATLIDCVFNNNHCGVYVEGGECPVLTGVSFGTGDEVNSVDVYPSSCQP